jgi:hypothetical protein
MNAHPATDTGDPAIGYSAAKESFIFSAGHPVYALTPAPNAYFVTLCGIGVGG